LPKNQKEAVKRYIEQVGLNISQFDFTLDGNGKLTLTGECATQADYEKVALTAGNIAGVAEVDNNMTVTSPIAAEEVKPTTYHTVEKRGYSLENSRNQLSRRKQICFDF
jgi:hypothetical protein